MAKFERQIPRGGTKNGRYRVRLPVKRYYVVAVCASPKRLNFRALSVPLTSNMEFERDWHEKQEEKRPVNRRRPIILIQALD